VIGRPELVADARFLTNSDRMRHIAELTALVAEKLRERPSAAWLGDFEAAGVPVGPVNRIGDMLADPSGGRARDGDRGRPSARRAHPGTRHALKFSEGGGEMTRPAPLLGQHSREILGQLGYSAQEIGGLAQGGAILLG